MKGKLTFAKGQIVIKARSIVTKGNNVKATEVEILDVETKEELIVKLPYTVSGADNSFLATDVLRMFIYD